MIELGVFIRREKITRQKYPMSVDISVFSHFYELQYFICLLVKPKRKHWFIFVNNDLHNSSSLIISKYLDLEDNI